MSADEEEIRRRFGVEIEVLKRLGMRWAVLTSLYHVLSNKKADLPPSLLKELKLTRFMIESGCFKVCDVTCSLNKVESALFQKAIDLEGKTSITG